MTVHPPKQIVSAAADGELEDAERARWSTHLDSCLACLSDIRANRSVDRGLVSMPALTCVAAAEAASARADGELAASEILILEAHLDACAPCRSAVVRQSDAWVAAGEALRVLPSGAPSRRVDDAVARIVTRERTRGRRTVGPRHALLAGVGAACAIVLAALATVTAPPAPIAQQEVVLVAGQLQVLDPVTNTLYVLRPDAATVEARDATTQQVLATVALGGRPTALALDPVRNTVVVLDAQQRTLTDVDRATHRVVSSTVVQMPGTLTTVNVESATGRILVSSVPSPSPGAPVAQSPAAGHVAVFDAATKQLETVRVLDVVPRQITLDHGGRRALVVSPEGVQIVNARTLEPIERLAGGVAATFSSDDARVAVLSKRDDAALLRIGDREIELDGAPIAVSPAGDGGFAVLVRDGGQGRVIQFDRSGGRVSENTVDPAATDLMFDPTTGRVSVIAAVMVAVVARPSAPPPAAPAALASPPPSPAAPAAAGPSPAPAASPSAAPSAPPSPAAAAPVPSPQATTPPVPAQIAPPGPSAPPAPSPLPGRPIEPGLRLVDTTAVGRPQLVAGSGARLWIATDRRLIVEIDASTGAVLGRHALPSHTRLSHLLVGRQHVIGLDTATGQVHVLRLEDRVLVDRPLPFLLPARAFALGLDDRLWIAIRESSHLIAYDVARHRIETVQLGPGTIDAIAADRTGRLWLADDTRGLLMSYELSTGRVREERVPRGGATTAMAFDNDATLWLGTSGGDLIGVRDALLTTRTTLPFPVIAFTPAAERGVWFIASDGPPASVVGHSGSPRSATSVEGRPGTLAIDHLGRVWYPDTPTGMFVIVPEGRR